LGSGSLEAISFSSASRALMLRGAFAMFFASFYFFSSFWAYFSSLFFLPISLTSSRDSRGFFGE
jgi:hypothetical protein